MGLHTTPPKSQWEKDENPCRRCNAPNWRSGHKCKTKNLFLCKKSNTSDDNDEESSNTPSSDTESDSDETGIEETNITLTLLVAAMTGISQPQTLKLFGYIKNTKVKVLIDSESTHNFIDSMVAKHLNIFNYLLEVSKY